MKKLLLLLAAELSVLVSGAFALDRNTIQNYMNQIQSLQTDITREQRAQQDLLRIKDLILEGDRTNKEETAKLRQDSNNFDAAINAHKVDRATLNEEEKRFDAELSTLKAQRDSNQQSIELHTAQYNQHNSWTPSPYDHAAVNAYNAEADQLNTEAASLNARKAQLDAAKENFVRRGNELDRRESGLEQKRQELIKRGSDLDRKESDLKWAREKLNEQTLKWAEDTKRNNALLNELAAQLNALLTKVSQLSSRCSSITGVGNLDLTNLNGASEQASRCLQQVWDGAGPGRPTPVQPKPGFKVTPN